MAEMSAEQIAQLAFDLNLLDDRQLQSIWGEFGRRNVPAEEFVQFLLRRELLTNFQLERMLRGERAGYFYGDYRVLYLVAGGTFARVYRAAHKESGKLVAIKVLRKRYSDDPSQTEHFCREGWVGVKLRHPNIVPVYEVYSKGLMHFLVMEFIEGRNLREFLKVRKKLEPAEATRLLIDLASGLSYAVERGVSHRDLKLTNILVSSRGQAKLVDFGLASTDAALVEDAAGEAPNQRTIDYAGLERATGVRKDDLRSDIYFMGSLYYHMLVGKSPLIETRDRIARLARSRFFDVLPIHKVDPTIPRVVATVVNTAMQLDPDRRFQTPAEMLVELNIAAERMAAGETEAGMPHEEGAPAQFWDSPQQASSNEASAAAIRPRSVMVVESNGRMQDIFRNGLKKAGYRVLVTSDARRALGRFGEDLRPADCVILSTAQIGEDAIEVFGEFASGPFTQSLPLILLLDPEHSGWAPRVQPHLADHRVLVPMPVKMRKFQELLNTLIPVTAARSPAPE